MDSIPFSSGGVVTGSSFGVSGKTRSIESALASRYRILRARAESSASKASLVVLVAPGSLCDDIRIPLTELAGEFELLEDDRGEGPEPWARLRRKAVAAAKVSSSRDMALASDSSIALETFP